MNQRQLVIGESTFGGRAELANPRGLLDCATLMTLALQRARTVREAIGVMDKLTGEYGYGDAGESFSIADAKEVWIMEIIGAGPGGKGAVWAAVRIPDGQISCHANGSRIGEFPRNDPANCLYSANVESFAASKGWWDPKSGRPLRFCDAYCPASPLSRRTCDARVWSVLRRAAPSRRLSPDYHRSKPGAKPYPLSLPPDKKLSTADVFALMRDHYEGTEFDMTQGVDAGPYGLPYRWRPLVWKLDGVDYAWERPISTQQTAMTFVSQSRPGCLTRSAASCGTAWTTPTPPASRLSTAASTRCRRASRAAPTTSSLGTRLGGSSTWSSNYAYLKYSLMAPEIQAAQKDIESNLLALQPAVEKTAVELSKSAPGLMTRYLTDYSTMHAEQTLVRWRELAEHLITKYNDGYVRDPQGNYPDVGYPEAWLRRVVRERPEQFRIPVEKAAPGEKARR